VADDGVGLCSNYSRNSSDRNTHIGLRNIELRLRAAYGQRATFALRSRDGGGVEAVITIIGVKEDGGRSCS
jgi:sensor histidine kinase YesM